MIFPGIIAAQQSFGLPKNNPTGSAVGRLRADHQRSAAVHGRLPAAVAVAQPGRRGRSIDTPDGLYCKLPQDSPIAVRGARNYPCMGHPGSGHPRSNSATTRGAFNRRRSVSTSSALPDRPEPGRRRASRWMTASTSTSGSTRRSRERRCRQVLRRRRIRPTRYRRVRRHRRSDRPAGPAPAAAPSRRRLLGQLDQRGADCPGRLLPTAPPGDPVAAPAAAPSAFNGNASGGGPSVAVAHYDPETGEYMRRTVRCSRCRIWLPEARRSRGRICCRSDADGIGDG